MRDQLINSLHASGLFDRDWYCATYPDVAQTGLDPMWHFVKYGLDLGRCPGPGFEPDFYATRYPDVALEGMVPLRHYLLHGRAEGRQPTAAAARMQDGMGRVRALQATLWGGLEDSAIPALQQLIDDPTQPEDVRLDAGCQLAFWLDFTGDATTAELLLQRLGGLSRRLARSPLRLIPLGTLYARRGATGAARQAFDTIPDGHQPGDRALAQANLDCDDAARLARINALYDAQGLVRLGLRDPDQPLRLDNLTTPEGPTRSGDRPLVSVILPAYRAEATIAAAIDSLQRQSHAQLEIIVVDDASPDKTFDIVSDLAQNDPRIVALQQASNGGAYAARNRGLAAARGAFITTHDADDWSHPQKIETQLDTLQAEAGLIGVIAHWARVQPPFHVTTNWRLSARLLQWSHSSFLFRREVSDRLGGWDAVRVSADMEFIWRTEAAFGTSAIRRILPDLPLAFALDDSASLTRNPLTHVRTTYGGLRYYYREISRYWIAQAPDGLSPAQQQVRHAMLPAAIWPGQDGSAPADLLLRGDFCDPAVINRMQEIADADPDRHIAISHRPDPGFTGRITGYAMQFHDNVFTLLQRNSVFIACPEDRVDAAETLSL